MKNKIIKLIEQGVTIKEIASHLHKQRFQIYALLTEKEINQARKIHLEYKVKMLEKVFHTQDLRI